MPIGGAPIHIKAFMHPHRNKLSFFALAALAAVFTPAHAATSKTTASIDNIRFELIDLNLADGITPSLTFKDQMFTNVIYDGVEYQESKVNPSMRSENAFGSVQGIVTSTSITSSVSVNHVPTHDNVEHVFTNTVAQWTSFTLSPHTQLIVTGVGSIAQERGAPLSYAKSSIRMQAYVWDGAFSESFSKEYQTTYGSFTTNLYGSMSSHEQALNFNLYLATEAVLTGISPVPEPSTYGMLLAGTFMVGTMARRQRRALARPVA